VTARRALTTLALLLAGLLALVVVLGRPRGALVAGLLAAALALTLVVRRAALTPPLRPPASRLVLVVLLLASVVQFHAAGGRIAGDGVSYYVYVRSLMKDGDLDFTNEYTHYGLIDRLDLKVPTRTGRRRSIFAVGPGLVWIPFFAAGEAVARVEEALGREVDRSGYGPEHVNAVALGSLLYGFAAVLLVHDLLRRHFPADTALLGAVLTWGATFLHWYMVHQPTMSHAPSTAGAALFVWMWDGERARPRWRASLLLGLAAGLAMCLRWQNALLLLLPAWDIVVALRAGGADARAAFGRGALTASAAILGAWPQMAAWKLIYGEWLLRYPPHGADFLRLDHPFILQTLFSSRHGLLFWTPVCWAGYLGYAWLVRWRSALVWPMLPPLAAMTYVNMCSGDWWAGGSFSNRRFDSLLPLLAVGIAGAIEWTRRALARHPQIAVCAALVPAMTWNLGVLAQAGRGTADPSRALFPALAGGVARTVTDVAGSPPAWPANWLFAWRERRPARQFDRAVGRYLFYRQNNLGGFVDVGGADDALLGEGWSPRREVAGRTCRGVAGRARVLAPLDVPEDLDLTLTAVSPSGPRAATVGVNGREAGRVLVAGDWTDSALVLPASLWRREMNDVVVAVDGAAGDDSVCVALLAFVRRGAPDAPRGFQAR
jgi:hypothetical protein